MCSRRYCGYWRECERELVRRSSPLRHLKLVRELNSASRSSLSGERRDEARLRHSLFSPTDEIALLRRLS
jgi:hypothetical protein